MSPEEVPAALVEKTCRARISAQWGRPVKDHEWAAVRSGIEEKWMAEALAAVLNLEEVWVGGPDALPLPPQVITPEGVFHEDGVTPMEITDEGMRAGGWKRRRRLSTEWEEA